MSLDNEMNNSEIPTELTAIFKRRSIRKFKLDAVPQEIIEILLQAAMAAPSAMNNQPWEFVVINDPEVLARIRHSLIFGRHEAPLAIAVCGNKQKARSKLSAADFWIQDCSAATENLLLAATALGLGTVWIGVHPVKVFSMAVSKVLGLPRHVLPLNIIYIGYPLEEKPAHTKHDQAKVHWQQFGKVKQSSEGRE